MVKAFAFLLLAACTREVVVTVPQIVTVPVPYVAIIPVESTDRPNVRGRVECDMVGHPYIRIRRGLPPEVQASTLLHERLHVAQAQAYGSCLRFAARYQQDSLFRLSTESAAYCGVLIAQRAAQMKPDPDFDTIVQILRFEYEAAYTHDLVIATLPCG